MATSGELGGWETMSQPSSSIFSRVFSYMQPSVVVKEVDGSTSQPFSKSVRQFLKLIGVDAAGDFLSLQGQLVTQH